MIQWARRIWFGIKESRFLRQYRDRAGRFGAIYAQRMWQNPESASGFGSTLAATAQLRDGLETLLAEEEIGSVLDAPCGDFNWQSHLRMDADYLGLDIVPDLIAENRLRHGTDRVRFDVADVVEDSLPGADLVMCRECLNHLGLDDARKAAENLAGAARRFLVITHYPDCRENVDQPASFRYRQLNLTLPPFNFRAPDASIDESNYEEGKRMAIWRLDAGSPVAAGEE